MFVLLLVMLAMGDIVFVSFNLLLAVFALLVALIVIAGLAFLVAVFNVRYCDTKHIVEIILLVGFWVSLVVYSVFFVVTHFWDSWVYMVYYFNFMMFVVVAF